MLTAGLALARRRRPLLLAAPLLGVCALFASFWLSQADAGQKRALAATQVHDVKATKFDAFQGNDLICTSSQVYMLVPGSDSTFKVGGKSARNVLISLNAEVLYSAFANIELRVTVDGVAQGIAPAEKDSVTETGQVVTEDLSSLVLTTPLAPGSHTVRLQVRSATSTNVCVQSWTYSIVHS
jgi:hypothetical protein